MSRTLTAAALLLFTASGCQEYELSNQHDPVGTETDNTGATSEVPPGVPTGGISGRICAPDGDTWVAGAMVAVEHEYGATATFTDGDGFFELGGLPVGTHTVEVTKGNFSTSFVVEVFADQITALAYSECVEQGETKIAVVTGQYDHIGAIIDDLGITYDTVNGVSNSEYVDFLNDPGWLAEYDAIFFNCGMGFDWESHPQATTNLKNYVRDGGSVYASDWAYFLVEATWPGQQVFHGDDSLLGEAFVGNSGMVSADVLDPVMASLLGSDTAQINYDLDAWAALVSVNGEVLIEGEYSYSADLFGPVQTRHAPLAYRMQDDGGTVIYTTFHNEQQTTVDMGLILQEIILSL